MANLAQNRNMFDELFDFRRDVDGLLNRFVAGAALSGGRGTAPVMTIPPIEARIDNRDKKYHVRMALPGVKPNEVQINVQGNTLVVSGEHKSEDEKNNSDYVSKEFSYEHFERVITLPEELDTENITAEFKNGMLEISAPFSAAALPKQIEIKESSEAGAGGSEAKSETKSSAGSEAKTKSAGV